MRLGRWEPHTSSVDFCEVNYLHFENIAELHNTWSSLLITAIAVLGFTFSNPTKEWRFSVMYLILGSIGVGSALLHSTLHWIPQSSDEVPMLWQTLSFTYNLMLMNQPAGSQLSLAYGGGFVLIAAAQTFVYYRYQQTYTVFLFSFAFYSLINTIWMGYLAFINGDAMCRVIRKKLFVSGFVCFGVIGSGVWLIDFHGCEQLSPYYLSAPHYLQGFTIHAFWHLFSASGVYLAIIFLVSVRAQTLKLSPELKFLYGFFPVIVCNNSRAYTNCAT